MDVTCPAGGAVVVSPAGELTAVDPNDSAPLTGCNVGREALVAGSHGFAAL